MNLDGKKVAVVGLGRSGIALMDFLHRRGAQITAIDQKTAAELDESLLLRLRQMNVRLELGDYSESALSSSDLIVMSPGVPLSLEPIRRAQEAAAPMIGEVELAFRFLKGRMIGVTGSNGKTTVTTLIGALLSRAGFPTLVGGNIGTPLTSLVERSREDGFVVVELSSFQLETIVTLRPTVAVVTNISPDHLDRHKTLGEYIRAKSRIFLNQIPEDVAVLNADDPLVVKMMYDTKARPILFSRRRELDEGVFLSDDYIIWRLGDREEVLIKLDEIPLRGQHNVENVLASLAAGMAVGASVESMREAIRSFPGVEHRLEMVAEIDGIDFYNDSKATNVDSAIKALESFDGNVILILGGRDKGSDYSPLRPPVAERVKQVLLLGESSDKIAAALHDVAPQTRVASMAEAVQRAYDLAEKGDTILLSPACASFDLFENFEHRGRVFKEEVRRLKLTAVNSMRLNLQIEDAGPANQAEIS